MRFPHLLLAASLIAAVPTVGGAQQHSVLEVQVRDAETGRPLLGAKVGVVGMGIEGLADEEGRVRMVGVAAGLRLVEAQLLGYARAERTVQLDAGGTARVQLDLEPSPVALQAVEVEGLDTPLEHNGFLARRAGGHGTFFTREEIEKIRPRYLSDLLRRVSGISVQPTRSGAARAISRGSRPGCNIQYYLNGVLAPFFDIDQILPGDVEGIEIYRGSATIPPAFNRGSALCGVVAIWTRMG